MIFRSADQNFLFSLSLSLIGRFVVLEEVNGLFSVIDQHSDTERRAMPDAATVYTLIGRLWHALGDTKKSVDCYVSAVKLNPYLWEAFLGLCDTGIVNSSAGSPV